MNLFVNKAQNVTAILGSVVYVVETNRAHQIVKTWAKGEGEGCTIDQRDASNAIKALIQSAEIKVGNRSELESKDADCMRVHNGGSRTNNYPMGIHISNDEKRKPYARR